MKSCTYCSIKYKTHEINLKNWCIKAGIDAPEYSYITNYMDNTYSVAVYVYYRSIDYYSQSEYIKSVKEAKEYSSFHCLKRLNTLWQYPINII